MLNRHLKALVFHTLECLAELDGSSIAKVYGMYEDRNFYYLVFEYVSGSNFYDYIMREEALTDKQVCQYVLTLLEMVNEIN